MTTTTQKPEVRVSDEQKTAILSVLAIATQPATNDEVIMAMVRDNPGRKISPYMIRRGLQELARDGIIGARAETTPERGVRSKRGTVARGVHSVLYWAHGLDVPARNTAEVFTGIKVPAGLSLAKNGNKLSARKKAVSKKRPAKAAAMQTGTPVNERPAKAATVQTGNRIDRLEARIEELEKTIRRLVDALN